MLTNFREMLQNAWKGHYAVIREAIEADWRKKNESSDSRTGLNHCLHNHCGISVCQGS